jgi:hypothetical protein
VTEIPRRGNNRALHCFVLQRRVGREQVLGAQERQQPPGEDTTAGLGQCPYLGFGYRRRSTKP